MGVLGVFVLLVPVILHKVVMGYHLVLIARKLGMTFFVATKNAHCRTVWVALRSAEPWTIAGDSPRT